MLTAEREKLGLPDGLSSRGMLDSVQIQIRPLSLSTLVQWVPQLNSVCPATLCVPSVSDPSSLLHVKARTGPVSPPPKPSDTSCSQCLKSFPSRAGLSSHRCSDQDQPVKRREFPCLHCEQVFLHQRTRWAHCRQHHMKTSQLKKSNKKRMSRGRCGVCTKSIVVTEAVERVYHCRPCAKTFTSLRIFLQHCQRHQRQPR